MKKILSMAFMLCVCAGIHADNEVLITIVTSPCDEVPNKWFPGEASNEQIKKAQKELLEECEKKREENAKREKELKEFN